MPPSYCFVFIGVFLFSSSLTNQILSNWSRPLAWIGLLVGSTLIIFFTYKNRGQGRTLFFFVQCIIYALTGVYVALYLLPPDEYGHLISYFKKIYISLLFISIFAINIRENKRLSGLWRTVARNAVKYSFFTVFLPLFLSATFSDQLFTADDSNPAKLIPFSLEKEGNLELSEFYGQFPEIPASEFKPDGKTLMIASRLPSGNYIRHPFFLVVKDGKTFSAFPLIPGLYNATVYFILKCTGVVVKAPEKIDFTSPGLKFQIQKDYLYLENIASAFLFAMTSVLFLKLISKFGSARTALLTTLIYSFGTTHFSSTSQTLWQHGFVELLVVGSAFLIFSKHLSLSKKYLSFGAIIGTFYFARPSSVIIAAAFGLVFLWDLKSTYENKDRFRKLTFISAGMSIPVLLFGSLNYSLYGHILGGYHLMEEGYALIGVPSFFAGSFPDGLLGLLFSPGFGLFIFSPFVLFVFYGFYIGRKKFGEVVLPTIFSLFAYLAIYSKYTVWWGGVSYGTRFLTDLMPLLSLFAFPVITKLYKLRSLRITFIIFVTISVWAQTSAIFFEEPFREWHACKRTATQTKAWIWDRTPYTMPFRKYYPFITGKMDIEPAYECQMGTPAGLIGERQAFEFDNNSVLFGSEKINSDIPVYLRSGNYCGETFVGSKNTAKASDSSVQILILQKNQTLMNHNFSPTLPNKIEFHIPKAGKMKISILKKGKSPILFAGIRIVSGSCK